MKPFYKCLQEYVLAVSGRVTSYPAVFDESHIFLLQDI